MRAGLLRHRVDVQSHAGGVDAHGDTSRDYATVATVWVEITPLSGRELEHARQVDGRVTHEIRTRYRRLTPKDRIRHREGADGRERIFHVVSVLNRDERSRELVILAVEQVP